MVTIEFSYNQMITVIQANLTDLFRDVVDKYYQKSLIPKDSVYFLVNGSIINLERTIESYMGNSNKERGKMNVLVNMIYKEKDNVIQESKEINLKLYVQNVKNHVS